MMSPPIDPARDALLDAILPHVPFDGWSPQAFRAALRDTGMDPAQARLVAPRGAVDLAVAYHERGDALMLAKLAEADLSGMRFRDRVAAALKFRIDAIGDKEALRRAATLFALPHMAPEGGRLVWRTADRIWEALGDTSRDGNWYSKRATLSGVWSAVVLYWLGDDSLDGQATDAFIDRRIDDVMAFEKVKARLRDNPLAKPFLAPLSKMMEGMRAPEKARDDLPGQWRRPE